MRKVFTFVVAAGAVAAATGTANAFVPWNNPNGVGNFFTWSGGGSDNGLFGSPTLVGGDTFVFFPQNFRANSTNGSVGDAHDRLEFQLDAFAGFDFSQITIREFGDYGIFPPGNPGYVSANMGLFVTDLNQFRVATDNQTFSATSGIANWTLASTTNLAAQTPPAWTKIKIVLNNNLIAISGANGSAFIEKKVTGALIITVPTPGTLALAGFGGLAAIRRRR